MVIGLTICLGHADAGCQCEWYDRDDLNQNSKIILAASRDVCSTRTYYAVEKNVLSKQSNQSDSGSKF